MAMPMNFVDSVSYHMNENHAKCFCGFSASPWTGWGIYAKQLCMALVSQGLAWPNTPYGASKTAACGYDWSLLSHQINTSSLDPLMPCHQTNTILT